MKPEVLQVTLLDLHLQLMHSALLFRVQMLDHLEKGKVWKSRERYERHGFSEKIQPKRSMMVHSPSFTT